jgi:hypothetical protein
MTTKPETAEDFASRVYATVDEEQVPLSLRLLTALITERDELIRAEGRERIAELEGKVRWFEAAQRETGDRITSLEAQLATAREGALREAIAVVRKAARDDGAEYDRHLNEHTRRGSDFDTLATIRHEKSVAGHAYADVERKLGLWLDQSTSARLQAQSTSPPPRVDGWIPVSERVPPNSTPVQVVCNGIVQLVPWRYIRQNAVWVCAVEVDGDTEAGPDGFECWQPLPAPPSQPDDGTPRLCPGCRALDGEHDFGPTCTLATIDDLVAALTPRGYAVVPVLGREPTAFDLAELKLRATKRVPTLEKEDVGNRALFRAGRAAEAARLAKLEAENEELTEELDAWRENGDLSMRAKLEGATKDAERWMARAEAAEKRAGELEEQLRRADERTEDARSAWESARELVRRMRAIEQVVAVYPLAEGGVVRRIRAALTGATEETKSDG